MEHSKIVLVAGGAGFIGSFLCEALLREGNRVICLDDFTTGHVRNIDPFLRQPNFQFLRLDINRPFDLETQPELESFQIAHNGIQEIYHVASPVSIEHFPDHRLESLLAHSIGTHHLLELAVKYQSRILLCSSSVVYGEGEGRLKEDDLGIVDHLSARASYDEGKRFAETMFSTYADLYGIIAPIARIFRTFGPRMPVFDGHQIPDMILQALGNEPIIVKGAKDSTTSLLYVTDLVNGLVRLMREEASVGAVNFGSDLPVTLGQLAERIVALTESSSTISYEEEPVFSPESGVADISKARETLAWTPLIKMDDGLKKTIDYIRANKLLLTTEGK